MEVYYDDERVTLGDGSVAIDQGVHGVQKVSGSRAFVRDPRLSKLAASVLDMPQRRRTPVRVETNEKWCACCGDTRPKHYFSPDKRAWDGLDYRCKECENERKRRLYALAVERPVRPYTRRD